MLCCAVTSGAFAGSFFIRSFYELKRPAVNNFSSVKPEKHEKLDKGQSPTLGRPATPLAACIQQHARMHYYSYRALTPSTECHRNSVVWIKTTKLVAMATLLERSKN